MSNRIRKVINFFAFNLLFFSIYLNFMHRDAPATASPVSGYENNALLLQQSLIRENEELKPSEQTPAFHDPVQAKSFSENIASLRLSIN